MTVRRPTTATFETVPLSVHNARHSQSQNLRSLSRRRRPTEQRQSLMSITNRRSETSVAFAPTHSFVLDVPVLLLTLDGAVARVPATVVHRLLLAVIALSHRYTH